MVDAIYGGVQDFTNNTLKGVKQIVSTSIFNVFSTKNTLTGNPGFTAQGNTYAKVEDNGSFANLASSGAEAGYTDNFQPIPDSPQNNVDRAYFGSASKFNFPRFTVDSVAIGFYSGDAIQWQYSRGGGSWGDLTIIYDGTDGSGSNDGAQPFSQPLDGNMLFSGPDDWEMDTVDGQNAYWIRMVVIDATLISGVPVLSANHSIESSIGGSSIPYDSAISRIRFGFQTQSATNNDTGVVLLNYTQKTATPIQTITAGLKEFIIEDIDFSVSADDLLYWYCTQGDGVSNYSNALLEMEVIRT